MNEAKCLDLVQMIEKDVAIGEATDKKAFYRFLGTHLQNCRGEERI